MIECNTVDRSGQKALIQIKHNMPLTLKNDEFQKVIREFWADFNNPDFNKNADKLVIVKSSYTKDENEHTKVIVDWSHTHATYDDWMVQIEVIQSKQDKLDIFKQLITNANNNTTPTNEDLYRFMRCLVLLEYDFSHNTSNSENNLLKTIEYYKNTKLTSREVLNYIASIIPKYNSTGGTLDIIELKNHKIYRYFNTSSIISKKLATLLQESSDKMQRIHRTISDYKIDRGILSTEIGDKIIKTDKLTVILEGVAGVGKSALLFDVLDYLKKKVLYIKSEQLNYPTLLETMQQLGIHDEVTKEIFIQLSIDSSFTVVIDGAEKLADSLNNSAFQELLQLQTEFNFLMILTCRSNIIDITEKFNISADKISIPILSEQEQNDINIHFPLLQNTSHKLKSLLAIPKYLDYILQVNGINSISSRKELREKLWQRIILDSNNKQTTDQIAIKQECLNILSNLQNTSKIVLDDLETREVIYYDAAWYFTHDIIEDWVIMEYTLAKFKSNNFFEDLNKDIYLQKGSFLWIDEAIVDHKDNDISLWLKNQLDNLDNKDFKLIYPWLQTMLVQIFYLEYTYKFYQLFYSQLTVHEYRLLFYCMQWINTTCKSVINHEDNKIKLVDTQAWNYTCQVLLKEYNNIDKYKFSNITDFIIHNIEGLLLYYNFLTSTDEKVSALPCIKLALLLLKNHKNISINEEQIKLLVVYLLHLEDIVKDNAIIPIITDELAMYKENESNEILSAFIASDLPDKIIQKYPKLIIKTMWRTWRFTRKIENYSILGAMPNYRDYDKYWGVRSDHRLIHPHYSKTIIYKMLQIHPLYATKFIVEFMNYSVKQFLKSECNENPLRQSVQVLSVDIKGITKKIYGSDFIWEIYRASSVSDHLLECLLMALEKFLMELKEKNTEESNQLFNSIVEYIFEHTNNIAPIAVIHSVFMMEENISDKDALHLFLHPELLRYDIKRQCDDSHRLRWHYNEPQNIRDDLDKSNTLPHRKFNLRDYINNYYIKLFSSNNTEQLELIYLKLDRIKEINTLSEVGLNLFYQMDYREWTITQDTKSPTQVNIIAGKLNEGPSINDIIAQPLSYSAKLSKVIDGDEDMSFEEWNEIYEYYKDSTGNNLLDKPLDLSFLGYIKFYDRLSKKQKQWCKNIAINNYSNYINSVPDRLLPKLLIPILKKNSDRYFWVVIYILNFINSSTINSHSEYIKYIRDELFQFSLELYKKIIRAIWLYTCEPQYDQFYSINKEVSKKYLIQKLYFSIHSCKYYFYKHPQKYLFNMLITFLYKNNNVKLDRLDLDRKFDNNLMMEFVQTIPYNIKDLELIRFRENYVRYYIEWYLNNDDKNNTNLLYIQLGEFIANLCIYSDENTYRELLISLIQRYQNKQHISKLSDLLHWSIDNIVRVMDHHDQSDEKLRSIYIPRFWKLWQDISENIKNDIFSYDKCIEPLLFMISGGWKEEAKDYFLFEGYGQNIEELMSKITRYGARATLYFLRTIGKERFMYQGLFWFKAVTDSYQWDDMYHNSNPSAERFIEEIEQKYQEQLQKNTEYREAFLYFLDNMINRGSDTAFAIKQRINLYLK